MEVWFLMGVKVGLHIGGEKRGVKMVETGGLWDSGQFHAQVGVVCAEGSRRGDTRV